MEPAGTYVLMATAQLAIPETWCRSCAGAAAAVVVQLVAEHNSPAQYVGPATEGPTAFTTKRKLFAPRVLARCALLCFLLSIPRVLEAAASGASSRGYQQVSKSDTTNSFASPSL